MKLMVERIIEFDSAESLDFDKIEQRIATLDVDDPDIPPEQLVEMAYSKANMRSRTGDHRITALGKSMEL